MPSTPPLARPPPAESAPCGAGGAGLVAPTFGPDGSLYAVASESGDIVSVANAAVFPLLNTGGNPTAVCFAEGALYVCDWAHRAILCRGSDGVLSEFVREYEGRDLLGPSGMTTDAKGNIYFTDSGPLGETTLGERGGSVFSISRDGQLLQPLALGTLSHPCGFALAPRGGSLYVCELLANRLLRFVQRPAGVWHCSVYFQFSGGLGPSAVACDEDGHVYVALFDFAGHGSGQGRVAVLSPQGTLVKEIACPGGAEVSGIALDPAGGALIVTDASTSRVHRLAI